MNVETQTLPKISILIPTLNSARTLPACLESIRSQDYPAGSLEIIIADAGSNDATTAIAQRFEVSRIVSNELKTGEAGKAAAAKEASGEILALIDSDNILPDPGWLKRMVAPFSDNQVIASEPIAYTRRDDDPPMTRYFAMLGMNDPLCLFIGNYDRICTLTEKWTEIPVETEDQGDWLKLKLEADRPTPTIGANGFLIRRSALAGVNWEPYWFDVDILRDAARSSPGGAVFVAKVKCGIVHLYCTTLEEFGRKQERRVRDFLYFSPERKQNSAHGEKRRTIFGVVKFTLTTVTVLPLLLQRSIGRRRVPDDAWNLHLPVCFMTLRKYSIGVLRKIFGAKQAPLSRDNWRQ